MSKFSRNLLLVIETNVASVTAVAAGLSLTSRLIGGPREDLVMGEARLHAAKGAGRPMTEDLPLAATAYLQLCSDVAARLALRGR